MVDSDIVQSAVSHFVRCRPDSVDIGQTPGTSTGGNETTGSQEGSKGDRLQHFFKGLPTSPISHIFNTRYWSTGKYRYMPRNSQLLTTVLFNLGLEYADMSTVDFFKMFSKCDPSHLIFNAPMGDISEYYFNLEDSIYVLEELLNFQCGSKENVYEFLVDLHGICDKTRLKLNTMFILSAPNAGKNYFFDAVVHYYLNFGQLGNFNKYCNFPLQECVNRRIILWNEPVCEPSGFETLKTIFGGDTANAKVKFQNDSIITRTPIIVLSNNDIFPKDEAFRTRMSSYKWNSCEHLKYVKKKPWPIAWPHLLKKYNVIDI